MFGGGGSAPAKPAAVKSKPTAATTKETKKVKLESPTVTLPKDVNSLVTWKIGEPVPYKFFSSMMIQLDSTTKRNEKIEIILKHSLAIACTTPGDLIPFAFMCTDSLRPAHEGLVLQCGDSVLIKALEAATGKSEANIKEQLIEIGDLGDIAMMSKSGQHKLDSMFGKVNKELTLSTVYDELIEIAKVQGNNAQRHRIGKISHLLTTASREEAKFIMRTLIGKLRVGIAISSLLVALGRMFKIRESLITGKTKQVDDESLDKAGKTLKHIYNRYALLDVILIKMLEGGFKLAEQYCDVTVGVPLNPMLAKPAKSIEEINSRIGNVPMTAEYKYDGERALIHKFKNGNVQIFSRNANETTAQFEEIKTFIPDKVKGEDFILDSEVVAYDLKNKHIMPFQTLMHRSRQGDEVPTVQICVFVFDVIFLNGKSMIEEPFSKRREILHEIVTEEEHLLQFATYHDAPIEDQTDFFKEAVNNRTEGLMIKRLDSVYQPGKRAQTWAKYKKDYIQPNSSSSSKASDSIDVVIVGAFHGKGQKTGLYSSFLVACYDPNQDRYYCLSKAGNGFSLQTLTEINQFLAQHIVPKPLHNVEYGRKKPDVYYEPLMVIEITVADFTISGDYSCCLNEVEEGKGISIRFNRALRIREDKKANEATETFRIAEMYYAQSNI